MPQHLHGEFGGPQSRFVAGPTGGTLSLGCASATIAGQIRLDGAGRFAVVGSYEDWQGGPQAVEESATTSAESARFDGILADGMLTLTISRDSGPPQTLTLERGRRSKVIGCY